MRTIKFIISAALFIIAATLIVCVTGCGQQNSEKLNAAYIQAVKDAYEKGEVNALDKFLAAEFVRHVPPNPDSKGLEAYKQSIVEFRRFYSDVQLTVNSMIMEGSTSAARWTFQATEMSTGKQVKVTGCTMSQWVNGKVVEYWSNEDQLGMFQQLGYKMLPPVTDNTFARVVVTQMKPEKAEDTIKIYKESVVPDLKKQKGFRGYMHLKDFNTGKGICVILWDSEADDIAATQSGFYKAQGDKFKDFLTAKPIREGYLVTVQE